MRENGEVRHCFYTRVIVTRCIYAVSHARRIMAASAVIAVPSVNEQDQRSFTRAIAFVLSAELRLQQPAFGSDAREQRRQDEDGQQHADP